MKLLALVALMSSMSICMAQHTPVERISALEEFKQNQEHYNDKEASRLALVTVGDKNELATKLDDLNKQQAQQNATLESLQASTTQAKTYGGLVLILLMPALGLMYWHLAKKNKAEDKLLARIDVLELFHIQAAQQIPLLTEVGDRLSAVLIEGVHHPDDTHVAADDLLDTLKAGTMSHADTKKLTGLMKDRSEDPNVGAKERNMAAELMPVKEALKKIRKLSEEKP